MKRIWKCKIGETDNLPHGSDLPMRNAVERAYREITGEDPMFIFSGWGAELTEPERAVVEDRLPIPAREDRIESLLTEIRDLLELIIGDRG